MGKMKEKTLIFNRNIVKIDFSNSWDNFPFTAVNYKVPLFIYFSFTPLCPITIPFNFKPLIFNFNKI